MKELYKGRRFSVQETTVKDRDNHPHRRDYVCHPGAVVILPFLDDGRVVLIRNWRYPVNETLWELPAGTLEAGEPPQETAKRELVEETGYSSTVMTPLFDFYTSPGFTDEKMYAFEAKGLTLVGQDLDATEEITVEPVTQEELFKLIQTNQIIDAKTLSTLFYYFLSTFRCCQKDLYSL